MPYGMRHPKLRKAEAPSRMPAARPPMRIAGHRGNETGGEDSWEEVMDRQRGASGSKRNNHATKPENAPAKAEAAR